MFMQYSAWTCRRTSGWFAAVRLSELPHHLSPISRALLHGVRLAFWHWQARSQTFPRNACRSCREVPQIRRTACSLGTIGLSPEQPWRTWRRRSSPFFCRLHLFFVFVWKKNWVPHWKTLAELTSSDSKTEKDSKRKFKFCCMLRIIHKRFFHRATFKTEPQVKRLENEKKIRVKKIRTYDSTW